MTTAIYQLAIPAAGNPFPAQQRYLDANGGVAAPGSARYRLDVAGTTPGPGNRGATLVRVLLSWPAAAALTSAAGSVETLVALDRN